jgi:hypothetical protein
MAPTFYFFSNDGDRISQKHLSMEKLTIISPQPAEEAKSAIPRSEIEIKSSPSSTPSSERKSDSNPGETRPQSPDDDLEHSPESMAAGPSSVSTTSTPLPPNDQALDNTPRVCYFWLLTQILITCEVSSVYYHENMHIKIITLIQ